MKVNSVNVNNNQQSFRGVIFYNKPKLLKNCEKTLSEMLKDGEVQEITESKDFILHIEPSGYERINYRIFAVGQGIKGILRNLLAPWKPYIFNENNKVISQYKSKWHPTAEDIFKAKIEKLHLALNLKRLEAERIAQLKARELEEYERLNKEIQKLIDIENSNKI